MSKHYDLIVIGSGPAGEKGAAQAAYFGKKVALIEKESVLGGAATNTGTLATKTLRELAFHHLKLRKHISSVPIREQINLDEYLQQENPLRKTEQKRIQLNLERHHIDLYSGFASFTEAHTITVTSNNEETDTLTGENILIAAGSSPYWPEFVPRDDPRFYDASTILKLRKLPQHLVIIGSGVVGSEYACIFAALDVNVILIGEKERPLAFLDHEVLLSLLKQMSGLGITLQMADPISAIKTSKPIEINLVSGKQCRADAVLVALGRRPNTEGLGFEKIGIALNPSGTIQVNERYQTTVPHIYAAGDIIGLPALAATSMEQARVAMVHAFDLKYKPALIPILPYGIYTIPECSMAGETEESLKAKKIEYIKGKANYHHNSRGRALDAEGFLKLLFRKQDMKLLGVHIVGAQAAELIHFGLGALQMNEGAEFFIQTCFNYPTLSEMYKYATYDALGKQQTGDGLSNSFVERINTNVRFDV